jgi:hypothetical protein
MNRQKQSPVTETGQGMGGRPGQVSSDAIVPDLSPTSKGQYE